MNYELLQYVMHHQFGCCSRDDVLINKANFSSIRVAFYHFPGSKWLSENYCPLSGYFVLSYVLWTHAALKGFFLKVFTKFQQQNTDFQWFTFCWFPEKNYENVLIKPQQESVPICSNEVRASLAMLFAPNLYYS